MSLNHQPLLIDIDDGYLHGQLHGQCIDCSYKYSLFHNANNRFAKMEDLTS